ADVYGLAATVFHLIAGEPPFPAPSRAEMPARVARGLPEPDPRCAGMPARLEQVIRAGLAAEPDRRPTLKEFAAELRGTLNQLLPDALLSPSGPAARPSGPSVRLVVARRGGDGTYTPLAATHRPLPATRDLTKVPPEPEGVVLRTGERVRV